MRYPSVRGVGVRYLIAVLLPISGAALVVYTAVQLAIAHATNSVPPPRRIAEASLSLDYFPSEEDLISDEPAAAPPGGAVLPAPVLAPADEQPPAAPPDPR